MTTQAYMKDPVTGGWGWTYVDHGPAKVDRLRGSQLTPRGAKHATNNQGRKITGRAAA